MTYAALQADVASWMARDDLTTEIPNFITRAEDRFDRVLRTIEMELRAIVTADTSTRFISLPTGFLEIVSMQLNENPYCELKYVAPNKIRRYYRDEINTQSRPSLYTIRGQFELDVVPDKAYSIEAHYFKTLDRLSDSNATNWLLESHSDIYLAAAMVEANLFVSDPSAAMMWQNKAEQAIKLLQEADDRKRNMGEDELISEDLVRIGSSYRNGFNINYD